MSALPPPSEDKRTSRERAESAAHNPEQTLRTRRNSGARRRDRRHCGAATACSSIDMAFVHKANGRKDRILRLVSITVQCVLAATASKKIEPPSLAPSLWQIQKI